MTSSDAAERVDSQIPRLHVVTDDRVLHEGWFLERAGRVLGVGGSQVAFHLRGPRSSGRFLWEVGSQVAARIREFGGVFLVNDRLDLAMALDAHGAHLGARSPDPHVARAVWRGDVLLGRSVRLRGEEGVELPPGFQKHLDFLFAGTVFRTASHPDREGAGPAAVARGIRTLSLPVVAIGGMTAERVPEVMATGVHGIAVIRAVWDADDPGVAVRDLLRRIDDVPQRRTSDGGMQ